MVPGITCDGETWDCPFSGISASYRKHLTALSVTTAFTERDFAHTQSQTHAHIL